MHLQKNAGHVLPLPYLLGKVEEFVNNRYPFKACKLDSTSDLNGGFDIMPVIFPLGGFSFSNQIPLFPHITIRRATSDEKNVVSKNLRIEYPWNEAVLEIDSRHYMGYTYSVISALRLFKKGRVGILEPIVQFPNGEESEKIIREDFHLSDLVAVIKTRGYRQPRSVFENEPFFERFYEGYVLRSKETADFKDFFEKFVEASKKFDDHLMISIIRMNRAQSYNDFIYGITDNIIALESLLKRQKENRGKSILRTRILLGHSNKERGDIYKHMDTCYKIRNDLVHGDGRKRVKGNLESIFMLEKYVSEVIKSAVPLYDRYRNKESVLNGIDASKSFSSNENRELRGYIQSFW